MGKCKRLQVPPWQFLCEHVPYTLPDLRGLSTRALNCLWRAGYHSAEALQGVTDEELLAIQNLGRNSLAEIRQVLKQRWYTEPCGTCAGKGFVVVQESS